MDFQQKECLLSSIRSLISSIFKSRKREKECNEDNRKITKYPVWTHLKKEKNLYVKNIYHNPRGGTRLIFLAHAKGFQSTLQRPKKKNVQVWSSMTRLNEHSPLIMPGCIMSPRHTFTNKQHCWSVNIHYYYADSNVTVLQPHHSLADMPVTERPPSTYAVWRSNGHLILPPTLCACAQR